VGVASALETRSLACIPVNTKWPHWFAAVAPSIYLGRYLRWNSWDVLRDPFKLLDNWAGSELLRQENQQRPRSR
jgi:hypothetical protein